MLDLALYGDNEVPITLCAISKRERISVSYLEQLFVKLRRHDIVKSYKGPGGGYTLSKDAKSINIATIIKVVDDDLDARTCKGMRNCQENHICLTHDLWNGLTDNVYSYLESITLGDLVDKIRSRNKGNQTEVKIAPINATRIR